MTRLIMNCQGVAKNSQLYTIYDINKANFRKEKKMMWNKQPENEAEFWAFDWRACLLAIFMGLSVSIGAIALIITVVG